VPSGRPPRRPRDGPIVARHRGRSDLPPLSGPLATTAAARAPARREWLDGILRPGPAALRARRGVEPPARRSVRAGHPLDAADAGAGRAGPGPGDAPG